MRYFLALLITCSAFQSSVQAPSPEPCVTHLESPQYPALARQMRILGKVLTTILVYRDGTISVTDKVSGHPLLVGAATENLTTWKFAVNDAKDPIPVDVVFEFELDEKHATYDASFNSAVALDLPHHLRIEAPAFKDIGVLKKKHWWSRN